MNFLKSEFGLLKSYTKDFKKMPPFLSVKPMADL